MVQGLFQVFISLISLCSDVVLRRLYLSRRLRLTVLALGSLFRYKEISIRKYLAP